MRIKEILLWNDGQLCMVRSMGKGNNKDSPKFSEGRQVTARGLQGVFTIIDGPNRKGELLISQNSTKFWVAESTLNLFEKRAGGKNAKRKAKIAASADLFEEAAPLGSRPAKRRDSRFALDLHGFTVNDAVERLESHLSRALLAEVSQFEVIHGIGTGAVRLAVHDFLKKCPYIRSFAYASNTPSFTVVYL